MPGDSVKTQDSSRQAIVDPFESVVGRSHGSTARASTNDTPKKHQELGHQSASDVSPNRISTANLIDKLACADQIAMFRGATYRTISLHPNRLFCSTFHSGSLNLIHIYTKPRNEGMNVCLSAGAGLVALRAQDRAEFAAIPGTIALLSMHAYFYYK